MTDNAQNKDLAWQLEELEKLVHDRFIQTNDNVKGAFTSGDFVEWRLRNIFGPQNISVELRDGPRVVTISESQAYTQALIRLSVRFADGTETYQDAVGVWPLAATKAKEGGTLEKTAPERYETVLKACQTDGIKAAAERLGTCFRPLSDLALKAFVAEREYRQKHPRQPGQTESEKEALFGTESPAPALESGNGREMLALPWRSMVLVPPGDHPDRKLDAEAFKVISQAITPANHLRNHLKAHYQVQGLGELTYEQLERLYSNATDLLNAKES